MVDSHNGYPNLRCSHCWELYPHASPACLSGNCPIESLAKNPLLERMCADFLRDRMLFEISKSELVYNRIIDNFGLADNPNLHLELENLFAQWMTTQREERKKHSKL